MEIKMRKKLVAGNWKMNMTPSEAAVLIDKLKKSCENDTVDVAFLVPSIDLFVAKEKLSGSKICYGAENFYFEEKGAFTGEISSDMLLDMGCKYVIIGHSERRDIFKEDDLLINKKLKKAIEKKLIPILCVGESLKTRESGKALSFVEAQVKAAFDSVDKDSAKNVVIAYEPIWAIGTGKTATSDEAETVCKYIREVVSKLYDNEVSDNMRILYGGSVNGSNAKELFSKPDIDGGLVGGASLKEDFINIVNYAR